MTSLAKLDHLVIMANSLDDGVDWCEATLGVTPGPGGEHPLMGTHNRLLRMIQWGDVHPTDSMPDSGVTLQALHIAHPSADQLQTAFDGIGIKGMAVHNAPGRITAIFQTPKGRVRLVS